MHVTVSVFVCVYEHLPTSENAVIQLNSQQRKMISLFLRGSELGAVAHNAFSCFTKHTHHSVEEKTKEGMMQINSECKVQEKAMRSSLQSNTQIAWVRAALKY